MQGPVLVDSIQLPQMDKRDHCDDAPALAAPGFRRHEFPPPLPSLARKSYNHLPLRVPWILLQANRSNNRVVLHEIKATHQRMLFQPIRCHGRLVLHMLRHDSDDELDRSDAEEEIEAAILGSSPDSAATSTASAIGIIDSSSSEAE